MGPGTKLGRYVLRDELGAGGMAVVFRAEDTALKREVAIKVLYPQIARRTELAGRFLREARAAAALDHPHILKIFDVGGGGGEADGDAPAYLVMELVRGVSLKEFLEKHGAPLAEIVALVGAALARALAAAHAAGVIHRDVKPANVMIADKGRIVLCDFGVARLANDDAVVTQTGAMLGTPAFMSPEQALAGDIDARSDVYSLGATLYQLATGALPYAGATPVVLAAVVKGELAPPLRKNPTMGRELARVIEKAMAREPEARFATGAALADTLEEIVRVGGVDADLARYFEAPGAWNEQARPKIVAATFARAQEAVTRREHAKALALCERVLALAPDHAEANALIASIGSGARRWRRAAIGAAILGACALAVAGVGVMGRKPPPPTATDTDTDTATATGSDSGSGTGTASDTVASELVVDAGSLIAADDAAPRVAARHPKIVVDAAPIAVALATPDAAVAVAPAMAVIDAVTITPWCEISIDGIAHGRSPTKQAISLAPGKHHLLCAQQTRSFAQDLDVAAGQHVTVTGKLVGSVAVHIDVTNAVIVVDGVTRPAGSITLEPGRHHVQITRGGRTEDQWIDVPTVPCTIREQPELACYEK